MSKARRGWALGVGAIALTLIVGSTRWHSASMGPAAQQREIAPPSYANYPRTQNAGEAETAASTPASQQGTSADGQVRFDGQGNPVTDAELRRHFDWYLAGLGEQDLSAIRARLARDMALRMTPAQRQDVLAWFDRYVSYQQASTRLAHIGDLRERLDAVHALRERMLGTNASDGFFGEEETEARRVLAMQQSQRGTDANPTRPSPARTDLEARSPGYAEAREESALRHQVSELTREFDRQDASAAERHSERAALLGPDAADRFADLDRERARWEGLVRAYVRARNALRARTSISPAQRAGQAQALLAGFTPAERRRIAGLEEAGLLP